MAPSSNWKNSAHSRFHENRSNGSKVKTWTHTNASILKQCMAHPETGPIPRLVATVSITSSACCFLQLQLPSVHTQNGKCFCVVIWLNKINLFYIFLGTLYTIYMSFIKICTAIYFYHFFIALLVSCGTRTDAAEHPTRFHCKGNTFHSQMKLMYWYLITETGVTIVFLAHADDQSTWLHCKSNTIIFQLKPLLNKYCRIKDDSFCGYSVSIYFMQSYRFKN